MTQIDDDLPLYLQWIGPNTDAAGRHNGWHGFVGTPDGRVLAAGSDHDGFESAKAACRDVARADAGRSRDP
jgi:hypothetical protein